VNTRGSADCSISRGCGASGDENFTEIKVLPRDSAVDTQAREHFTAADQEKVMWGNAARLLHL
jgi:hypothetical protein